MNASFASCARAVVVMTALSTGLLVAVPAASHAAVNASTYNWTDWTTAHAEIWIYNSAFCHQSVAQMGSRVVMGQPSWSHSAAHVVGFSSTRSAYQRTC